MARRAFPDHSHVETESPRRRFRLFSFIPVIFPCIPVIEDTKTGGMNHGPSTWSRPSVSCQNNSGGTDVCGGDRDRCFDKLFPAHFSPYFRVCLRSSAETRISSARASSIRSVSPVSSTVFRAGHPMPPWRKSAISGAGGLQKHRGDRSQPVRPQVTDVQRLTLAHLESHRSSITKESRTAPTRS